MRNKHLVIGIVCVVIGIGLLAIALMNPSLRHASLLWGLAGGIIGPGIARVWKYVYWTRPSRRMEYEQKLHDEQIRLKDERNLTIHEKAGRVAYLLSLLAVTLIIFALVAVKILTEIVVPQYVLLIFSGLLLFQIISYQVFVRRIQKKL